VFYASFLVQNSKILYAIYKVRIKRFCYVNIVTTYLYACVVGIN